MGVLMLPIWIAFYSERYELILFGYAIGLLTGYVVTKRLARPEE